MAGNVVENLAALKSIGVGTTPFTDGFNVIVKDINGDDSILPLTYIWLNRPSVGNGLKVIKPDNNLGGWYLMQVLGEALPVNINATQLNSQSGSFYTDRNNHVGTQPVNTITGLGGSALLNVGTASNTVAEGNDARFGISTILNGQPSSYYLNRLNHTGSIDLTSLGLLTGYLTGSAVAINATDSVLSAFGKSQAQINNKADLVGGLVPSNQLPSYVDDVLEYTNLAAFPVTGESGKLYVAIDTNLVYRWSGSTYAGTSSSLALGTTSTTAHRGDFGNTAYTHSQVTGTNPHAVTKANVGLGNADNTADTAKPVSTAQQTALNLKANLASPTFTGSVAGITAAMVGLGNLTNLTQVDTSSNQSNIGGAKTFTNLVFFTGSLTGNSTLYQSPKSYNYVIGSSQTAVGLACPNAPTNSRLAEFVLQTDGAFKFRFVDDAYVNVVVPIAASTTAISLFGSTGIKYVLSAVVSYDPPSIAASATITQDFTVTGAVIGDTVTVTPQNVDWYVNGWVFHLKAWVQAANTVRIMHGHQWPSALDLPASTFRITVIGF